MCSAKERAQSKGTWLLLVSSATADAGAVQKLLQNGLDLRAAHLDQMQFAGAGSTGAPVLRRREAFLFQFLPIASQIPLCVCSVRPL